MERAQEIIGRLFAAIRDFRNSSRQAFNLVAGAIALGAVISVAFYLFNPAAPVVLASSLAPADHTAIALRLRRAGIHFTLGPDSISVPSWQLHEAERVLQGSPGFTGGTEDFSLFDRPAMGQSDFDEQVNYQRSLQGEIERTIMNISGIENARVMLAMGRPSPFALGPSEATRASVMLTTVPGAMIDPVMARAIAHLVAGSVRGLQVEQCNRHDQRRRDHLSRSARWRAGRGDSAPQRLRTFARGKGLDAAQPDHGAQPLRGRSLG